MEAIPTLFGSRDRYSEAYQQLGRKNKEGFEMTIYLVVSLPEYESGRVYGVYSTRAAAENSWHMKYEEYNEIQEFELDLDPNAEVGDPGFWHGPQTESQHQLARIMNEAFGNLQTSVWKMSEVKTLPERTGIPIQFYSTEAVCKLYPEALGGTPLSEKI
jgi:hypothetical protein